MIGVVRRNPAFRRIWLAQVVSQLGTWFNRVAVLALIGQLGGEQAVGALFATELAIRLLPTAVFSSLAGPVADRVPRRLLMVCANLAQAVTVLLLMVVDEPGELPLLYGLVTLHMSLSIFFHSAQSASVPNVVPREDLHEANALNALTWSMMLSLGALAGGLVASAIGVRAVFAIDALTFLVSAALLMGLRLPPVPAHPTPFRWRDVLLLVEMRAGWRHAVARGIAWPMLAKTFWGGAGGYLVLLSIAGSERFGSPDSATAATAVAPAAFAIGALYCARGIGTGIGPLIARRVSGSSDSQLLRQIATGFALGSLGYAVFAWMENLWLAFAVVVLAHSGGSMIWVASTTFWQKHAEDEFRGRVFALEFVGMTIAFSAGGALGGLLYDRTESIAVTTWVLSGLVALCGGCWVLFTQRSRAAARRVGAPPVGG
jgi:predicted MFS family arabinose efflux permease